jgi:hypothetical protein
MADHPKCQHVFAIAVDERKLVWPFCIHCYTMISTKAAPSETLKRQIAKNPRRKFVLGSVG